MRPYEVMVIFDAELDEETVRSAVARYTQLIEGKGAQPGPVDFWGKRRFAYELKHRWEGYYVVLQAKAEPPAMDELHRVLSLADEVLRHKILRIPEQVYGKLTGPGYAPPARTAPAPEPEAPVSEVPISETPVSETAVSDVPAPEATDDVVEPEPPDDEPEGVEVDAAADA